MELSENDPGSKPEKRVITPYSDLMSRPVRGSIWLHDNNQLIFASGTEMTMCHIWYKKQRKYKQKPLNRLIKYAQFWHTHIVIYYENLLFS